MPYRHGPKPGCQEAEAEAFSILKAEARAEALTLFKLDNKAEAMVMKPKPKAQARLFVENQIAK